MRNGLLGSVAALVAGAGLAVAQTGPNPKRDPWASTPAFQAMPSAGPVSPVPGGLASQTAPAATSSGPAQAQNTPLAPGDFPVAGEPIWTPYDGALRTEDYEDEGEKHYGPGPVPYRLWADAEYLLFWVKPGIQPPPLISTGTPTSLGVLRAPGSSVLFANELDYGTHSGGRLTVGGWLDQGGHVGVEAVAFLLEGKVVRENAASDATGLPILARPIVNATTGQEAVTLVSFPGSFTGNIGISSSEQLYGGEANFLGSLYRGPCFCADMIIGFRYVGLDEKLGVTSNTTAGATGLIGFNGMPAPAGSTVTIADRFETRNDFYGGQLGARALYHWEKLFVSLQGTLAVGNAHEVVNIGGDTSLSGTAAPATVPGGLLAVGSNSGLHSHDEFTFVPGATAKVGYNLRDCISFYVGYSFLYWYDVARPSEQIDRVVNPGFVPSNLAFGTITTPVRPLGTVNRTDFWAQGVTFGLEIRY